MSEHDIPGLATRSALVIHVEQITGGAATDCHCGADATLYITSEPDMEPGPVCNVHAWQWINVTLALLGDLFPVDDPRGREVSPNPSL